MDMSMKKQHESILLLPQMDEEGTDAVGGSCHPRV